MYQIWGSGMVSQELLQNWGFNPGLEVLFPNSTDLRITIEPICHRWWLRKTTSGTAMGESYIAVHNGDYANGDIRLEVYSHIFAPLTMGVSSMSATLEARRADVVYSKF